MRRNVWIVLAAGLLLGANQQGDEAKKDEAKFQGEWVATLMEVNGEKFPEDQAKACTFTFTGDKYVQKVGGAVVEEGTQKLDPTKKPKAMDVTVTGGETKGKTQLAIYEIDGDTIKMCFNQHDSKERPTEFASKSGTPNVILIHIKKVTDKDKKDK